MVKRFCPVCGGQYQADPARLKHGRQTTCSRRCSYSLRGQIKALAITGLCGVCGTPVTRPPSHVTRSKTTAFLCSPVCAYRARTIALVGREVLQHYTIPEATRQANAKRRVALNALRKAGGRYACSEATKAKLPKTTALAIAEGRIPRISSLERLDCLDHVVFLSRTGRTGRTSRGVLLW